MNLSSPIGLAAGLDKDGIAIPIWPQLGFGFIEVGTVTAHPQEGNPKPRLFRLKEEKGLINRMGFNNLGSKALAQNIRSVREKGLWPQIPVGANVGKSKITPLEEAGEDYRISIERLQGLVDYFTHKCIFSKYTRFTRFYNPQTIYKNCLIPHCPQVKTHLSLLNFHPI